MSAVVMAGHVIQWEYDDGILRGVVTCREPEGADCQLGPSDYRVCACESWHIERDEGGAAFHMIEGERHDMEPSNYCNVELFINESDALTEMYEGRFVIGETAIEPVWTGDGCDWKPVQS